MHGQFHYLYRRGFGDAGLLVVVVTVEARGTKHAGRRSVWMWVSVSVSVWVARPVGGARLALGWRVRRRVQAKLHY